MRVIVLVDGEHYPPVTRWGIDVARTRGHEVLAAVLMGGIEKIDTTAIPDLGIPLTQAGRDPKEALLSALAVYRPEAVLDLSDEPVLGYRERMEMAAVALAYGVSYMGPGFRLDPPVSGEHLRVPTIAVIGTGKRTGKTAIAGELARTAARMGLAPVLVAMGRGGPAEPQVAKAGSVDLRRLIQIAGSGEHAASDYLEDAVMSGVTTIGARRAGGGLAGEPYASNVRAAAELALEHDPGLIILEGSGAAVPPVPWDAGILIVPGDAPPEYVGGYLGPFRLLLSDLVVLTMATGPMVGPENLSALRSHIRRLRSDARLVETDFFPFPLEDVRGKRAFLTTTAPELVAARQAEHIAAEHGCQIVGWSARLADRAGLIEDLDSADGYDVLLTELKAAAVEVACERALAKGAEVVFFDNRAKAVEGAPLFSTALEEVIRLAQERGNAR